MSSKLSRRLSATAAVACLAVLPAAASSAQTAPRTVAADAGANVTVDVTAAGISVAGAGDVNGDGRPDLIVGAPASAPGRAGAAYVVFGTETPERVDLGALGAAGFVIEAATPGDGVGFAVSGAGDVNGDKLADVVVGAPFADNNGRENSGSAYVVFGKKSVDPVRLAALGAGGFRIDGPRTAAAGEPGDGLGRSVGAAGDVNGDDVADVVVGAPFASHNARIRSGSAYVVFGRTATTPVDVATAGAQARRIDGAAADDGAGEAVSGAGDVNRDGFDDVVLGAPTASGRRAGAGAAYVVFGTSSPAPLDLAHLGAQGIRVEGAATGDYAGHAVAGAGDFNGDELPDVVVGAPYASNNGRRFSGAAYVVFGRKTTEPADLAALGAYGLRLDGAAVGDFTGYSVAGAGDVNGDKRADVIVGAPDASPRRRLRAGSAYVVFGSNRTAPMDLANFVDVGFRIDGFATLAPSAGGRFNPRRDAAGASVAGIGDVDGDELGDVLVGAPGADNNGPGSGAAYLVRGRKATDPLDLPALGNAGSRIDGPRTQGTPGASPPPAPAPPRPAGLAIRRFSLSPARPRPGRALTAVAVVNLGGRPLTSGRVACRVTIGGKAASATLRRFARGAATCRWSIPASGAGKLVRGSITVTSGRSTASRRFAVRIARR